MTNISGVVEPLRIGVLGTARISEQSIVRPARETGHRIVAVAARDVDRAERFAAKHGIERVAATYQVLLDDDEVELIYNPLVNALHGPLNILALRAGKHVLSEKPSASNRLEALSVRHEVEQSGRCFIEAFHYLFHPVFERLLEIVGSGHIGRVVRTDVRLTIPDPGDDDPRWSHRLGGGAMMDLGCYAVHVSRMLGRFLGGEPLVTSARAVQRRGAPGVDQAMTAEVRYPHGATGRINADMCGVGFDFRCRVIGTDGEVIAPGFVTPHLNDRVITIVQGNRVVEHMGKRPSYTYQLEAVAAQIRGGRSVVTDGDDSIATMTLIDQVYRASGLDPRPSADLGTVVR
jgi:predicted dehydrogenase